MCESELRKRGRKMGRERWPASLIWISKCKHTYTHTSNIHSKALLVITSSLFLLLPLLQVQISLGTINTVYIGNDVRTREREREPQAVPFSNKIEKKETRKEEEFERWIHRKIFQVWQSKWVWKILETLFYLYLHPISLSSLSFPQHNKKVTQIHSLTLLDKKEDVCIQWPQYSLSLSLLLKTSNLVRKFLFISQVYFHLHSLQPFEHTLFLFFPFLHRSLTSYSEKRGERKRVPKTRPPDDRLKWRVTTATRWWAWWFPPLCFVVLYFLWGERKGRKVQEPRRFRVRIRW